MVAAGIAALVWAGRKVSGAASGVYDSVTESASEAWDGVQAWDERYTPQYVLDAGGIWELNKKVLNSVNPASDQNIVYGGVNAIGAWATGTPSGDWSLGSWLYDLTNPPPKNTGGATGSW